MKPFETLEISRQEPVVFAQINRPDVQNSINDRLIAELMDVIEQADLDDSVKILVLEGSADYFCTGLDFQEFSGVAKQGGPTRDFTTSYWKLLERLGGCSLIVVSLVRGKVNAGGVGLAAASDLVLAEPQASFALSELLFGLLPACVLPFLIRRVGFQKARTMALTTSPIDAEEAYRWGLVDEFGNDCRQLLNKRLSRLSRLQSSSIGNLKQYTEKLWTINEQTRDLAVNAISSLIDDSEVRSRITRFVLEGIYPWQQ